MSILEDILFSIDHGRVHDSGPSGGCSASTHYAMSFVALRVLLTSDVPMTLGCTEESPRNIEKHFGKKVGLTSARTSTKLKECTGTSELLCVQLPLPIG